MTKRDQILRAWIAREAKGQPWVSHISYKGTVHKKATQTHIRRAAIQFADLHLRDFFTEKPAVPATEQTTLF